MSTTTTRTCSSTLPAGPAPDHPERCSEHWCRVSPYATADGHVTNWAGWHRSEADVTMFDDDCIVAEVSTGLVEDPPAVSPLFVHLLMRTTHDAGECFEAGLTPAEARALAELLTDKADYAEWATRYDAGEDVKLATAVVPDGLGWRIDED